MNHKLVEMLLNGSENEKLCAKLIPVFVKDVYTNQLRKTRLFFSMEWRDASYGTYQKELSITLTDNDDISFLYHCNLNEEEFDRLKKQQNLKIDFSSLPQHLIGHVEKCLIHEKDPEPGLTFEFHRSPDMAGKSQFLIVEPREMRNFEHVYLDFIAATASALRQYQTTVFKCLKEENRQLKNNLAFMEQDLKDKLSACQQTLNCKMEELEIVKKEMNVELTLKDNNHKKELQEEREKLINRHKSEMKKLENDIKTKEHNFHKQIQQYESRVNVLDTLNKELQDKIYKHESTIRELKSKVFSLEDEMKHLKENLQSYKYKCDHLQSEVKEKQSHIHQQDEIINDLQQELRSKEQSVLKLKDKIESEIESKKLIENELENMKFRLDMSEKQLQVLENEKENLNEIIIGLQEKSKEISKEDKNKNHLVAKYRKIIEEKEKALLDEKQKISELNMALLDKNAEMKSISDSNNILVQKLDELSRELTQRDNVIRFLKGQMTEKGVVPQYTAPPHLTTSPSAIAQKELAKISSQNPENSSPLIAGKIATAKSVRIQGSSPECRRHSSSTPSQFQNTPDSAYASSHSKQATPEIVAGHHNINFDPTNFEADQEALSAAFGNGQNNFKHSTAKKPTKPPTKPIKPTKSSTPKSSKKR